ncbi:MAG: response regulator [Gammaproteobacteria bacterium]|nr:response regulator [Gammaproteobacteria bacterium]MCW8986113.1 response regulator [Gammaproteobacteria bacterium]
MLRTLLFFILTAYWATSGASNPYQIFVLHSYSQEYPWTKNQHNGFTENYYATTNKSSLISSEYLDTKRRKFNKEYKEDFYRYLQKKYAGYTPDLIYLTDDDSLTFALEYFNDLFKSVPIIFSGINNLSLQDQLDPSRVTGVYEKKDISKNIEILKALDPDFNEIIVVGDASSTYRVIEEEIKLQLKKHPNITAHYIAEQKIGDLTKALKQHKEKYIFLTTLGQITDSSGNTQTLKNTISLIAHVGDFTIISMEDNYLQKGVLGGYVTSGRLQGKTAAELAIEFQKNRIIGTVKAVTESSNEYIFDHIELTKKNLVLPESIESQSVILNKPLSFYQRNRTIILGIIIGLTLLLIVSLVIFLIILARKNHQIRASTYKEQELGQLINDATKEMLVERQNLNQAQAITNIGNYSWDINNNITTWSDELYRIVGHTPSELTPSYDAYVKSIHPDDKNKFRALTENVLQTKDSYQLEYRIMRADGEVRYVYEQGEVKLDSNNNVVGLDGVIQDITQRKHNEEEHNRLQRELTQARKMEALGQLTGGIAHDFNNMLSIIIGFSDLALENYNDSLDPKILKYFENISQASHRARDLVQKMMAFSRKDQGKNEPLNLAEVIDESLQMLRSIIPSSIEIIYHYDENLPKVMMDYVQLQQIIMNLCLNAKDAMNNSGTLTIQLRQRHNVNDECMACHKQVLGTWVELSVSDTGSGLPPGIIDHIFEPFFTTKEVSKGTGMGLSIIHSIVDNHHGHILIDTEINRGSTFHVLFPGINTSSISQEESHQLPLAEVETGNSEKVLIVDDEPILAEWIKEYLTEHNYQCTIKNSSAEAWQLFEADPNQFDLLITDQTMPGMNGTELIEKIRNLKPGLPVILVTGYSETITQSEAEEKDIIYVSKPIDASSFLKQVATVLQTIY